VNIGFYDEKNQISAEGFVEGRNFTKKTSAHMAGETKEASQEAPEAIESKRIPRAYREISKGFFRILGGQVEKEKKKK